MLPLVTIIIPTYELLIKSCPLLKLLNSLKHYYSGFPYFTGIVNNNLRYNEAGAFYRHSDAIFLYSIMRHFKPQRIIEIGSGHSSALMLDINEI